nr:hypothetical protein [Kibdelosporangium sp. MJ126-NF4]CEL19610.1 hypothetical protein [Kibdelosporangium sp. MJ126-NF4]CTQ94590.1 hypothetical protein [Kibdelosporangium sp. MJ126-NF4]
MSGFLNGALLVVPLLAAARLLLFCLALVAHHRWRIPVASIERLIRACFPQRKRDRC